MSLNIWELLTFNEIICPSCGSAWYPSVSRPLSCPRCKSYTVSKNRQPWPEGYIDAAFYRRDFEIQDPSWKAEEDQIDRDVRLRKRVIFEEIHKEWLKEFKECERKKRISAIIKMFRENEPTSEIAKKFGMSQREVNELLVAQKVAYWVKKPE